MLFEVLQCLPGTKCRGIIWVMKKQNGSNRQLMQSVISKNPGVAKNAPKDEYVETNLGFVNSNGVLLSEKELVSNIAIFVDEDPSGYYLLVIGTDSQTKNTNGEAEIDFVTAVIIYRKGKGARYFWRKEKHHTNPVLRDKIYRETLMSLDVAHRIVPKIRKLISPGKYDFEIHIDVGPLGPTREMIREVVGMVQGNGFVAKTKPYSWGASSVADKHA
jgi:uncharacterized protein